jgi:ribosomal protein L7/L12
MIKTSSMVTDLVNAIQEKLGYPPLDKVDPNSQEIKGAKKISPAQKLPQAAIPAVLAAMIKYSDGTDGINLLALNDNSNWLETFYGDKKNDAVKKVADYSGVSAEEAQRNMEDISTEAVRLVRDSVKNADAEKLRSYMNSQRHTILSHLPAVLKIGDTLNEETFDDRTNKMEGPVSSFLHKIENRI